MNQNNTRNGYLCVYTDFTKEITQTESQKNGGRKIHVSAARMRAHRLLRRITRKSLLEKLERSRSNIQEVKCGGVVAGEHDHRLRLAHGAAKFQSFFEGNDCVQRSEEEQHFRGINAGREYQRI